MPISCLGNHADTRWERNSPNQGLIPGRLQKRTPGHESIALCGNKTAEAEAVPWGYSQLDRSDTA